MQPQTSQPQILLEFYWRYYSHTAILDRLLKEVLTYMAMAYNMARSSRYNIKKNFFVLLWQYALYACRITGFKLRN